MSTLTLNPDTNSRKVNFFANRSTRNVKNQVTCIKKSLSSPGSRATIKKDFLFSIYWTLIQLHNKIHPLNLTVVKMIF